MLVTDGDERASLAAVRSLGRAGWTVHVVAGRRASIAGASRYAAANHVAADPLGDPRAFQHDVARLAARLQPRVLLPVSEAALLALGEDRGAFAPAVVPFPPLAAIRRAADKEEVGRVAAGLGIAVPETLALGAPRGLGDRELEALPFPVVLKPARSVRPDTAPGGKFVVTYAAGPSELADALARMPAAAYPVLLQRRVRGPGAGVFLLVDGRAVLAEFAHRRIRERPPSGGVSVFRESVALAPELRDAAARLLAALGWSGVAMVEFKLDDATGRPYLMEVNPRLWGSLQLAIDAGVDFPRLLVEWALGARPETVPDYAVGVRSRWLLGEVDHLIARTRAGFARGVVPGVRECIGCLAEQLSGRGADTRLEVLRADDPRPFLREGRRWLGDVLR